MTGTDSRNRDLKRNLLRQRYQTDLTKALSEAGSGPILVHSDLARVMSVVAPERSPRALLGRHIKLLQEVAGKRPLWFPTFNYDFTRSGHFSVSDDPSQVGALSEFARNSFTCWRTPIPVFSMAGNGPIPDPVLSYELDPFGLQSAFSILVELDGAILLHGAGLQSCTTIHHAERKTGGPVYRYDKLFSGEVVDFDGSCREHVFRYHVRPMGRRLDYDWSRLRTELQEACIACEVTVPGGTGLVLGARALVNHWSQQIRHDPLYLLDAESRAWVAPVLDRLGRPFQLEDFEEV